MTIHELLSCCLSSFPKSLHLRAGEAREKLFTPYDEFPNGMIHYGTCSEKVIAPPKLSDGAAKKRVLLLGDSLTTGSYGEAPPHPYGLRLQDHFNWAGVDVEVKVSGVPGDIACGQQMESRLRAAISEASTTNGLAFDWVVILAGTNDVHHGYSAFDIFKALQNLYGICNSNGARVLSLTVPEYDVEGLNSKDYQRRLLNEQLMAYAKHTPGHVVLKLHELFPLHILAGEARRRVWHTDGIHPNAAGYDQIGDLVFDALWKAGSWE